MIFVMLISWGHLTAQVSHMAQSHKVRDCSTIAFRPSWMARIN